MECSVCDVVDHTDTRTQTHRHTHTRTHTHLESIGQTGWLVPEGAMEFILTQTQC